MHSLCIVRTCQHGTHSSVEQTIDVLFEIAIARRQRDLIDCAVELKWTREPTKQQSSPTFKSSIVTARNARTAHGSYTCDN
jgi:hypothetical protein